MRKKITSSYPLFSSLQTAVLLTILFASAMTAMQRYTRSTEVTTADTNINFLSISLLMLFGPQSVSLLAAASLALTQANAMPVCALIYAEKGEGSGHDIDLILAQNSLVSEQFHDARYDRGELVAGFRPFPHLPITEADLAIAQNMRFAKRNPGQFSFAGGSADERLSIRDACSEQLREELGLAVVSTGRDKYSFASYKDEQRFPIEEIHTLAFLNDGTRESLHTVPPPYVEYADKRSTFATTFYRVMPEVLAEVFAAIKTNLRERHTQDQELGNVELVSIEEAIPLLAEPGTITIGQMERWIAAALHPLANKPAPAMDNKYAPSYARDIYQAAYELTLIPLSGMPPLGMLAKLNAWLVQSLYALAHAKSLLAKLPEDGLHKVIAHEEMMGRFRADVSEKRRIKDSYHEVIAPAITWSRCRTTQDVNRVITAKLPVRIQDPILDDALLNLIKVVATEIDRNNKRAMLAYHSSRFSVLREETLKQHGSRLFSSQAMLEPVDDHDRDDVIASSTALRAKA